MNYLTVKDYSEKYNIPMVKVCSRIKQNKLKIIKNEDGVTLIEDNQEEKS